MNSTSRKQLARTLPLVIYIEASGNVVFHIVTPVRRSLVAQVTLTRQPPRCRQRFCMEEVWVARRWRGCGVGRRLARRVMRWLDEHHVGCCSWVNSYDKGPMNDSALLRWYQSLGFRANKRKERGMFWIVRQGCRV